MCVCVDSERVRGRVREREGERETERERERERRHTLTESTKKPVPANCRPNCSRLTPPTRSLQPLHSSTHLLKAVVALARRVNAGEQVAQQAGEDDHILRQDLGHVEVTQRAVQHVALVLSR
jgi:hypothetical protein